MHNHVGSGQFAVYFTTKKTPPFLDFLWGKKLVIVTLSINLEVDYIYIVFHITNLVKHLPQWYNVCLKN